MEKIWKNLPTMQPIVNVRPALAKSADDGTNSQFWPNNSGMLSALQCEPRKYM